MASIGVLISAIYYLLTQNKVNSIKDDGKKIQEWYQNKQIELVNNETVLVDDIRKDLDNKLVENEKKITAIKNTRGNLDENINDLKSLGY